MKLIIIKRHSLADLSGDPEADLIREKNPYTLVITGYSLYILEYMPWSPTKQASKPSNVTLGKYISFLLRRGQIIAICMFVMRIRNNMTKFLANKSLVIGIYYGGK